MRNILIILTMFSILSHASADELHKNHQLSIGAGVSKDNIGIFRIGIKNSFETPYLHSKYGWLGGYYEFSFNYWKRAEVEITGIATSPVFVYYIGDKSDYYLPYIEAGIGFSFISDRNIRTRDMSTNFNFEDRIGIGVKIEDIDLSARYMHYSNASIVNPNDGIDIFIFTLSSKF